MNKSGRSVLIVGITFAVLIGIFWYALPLTGIAAVFGGSYIFVSLIGSLLISILVSRLLNRYL